MKQSALQLRPRAVAVGAITCLLVLFALTALAQSGRRAKKSSLPPVPTPEASPTPTSSPTPERPKIPVLLGANSMDSYGDIPFYFNDSVVKSCAQGLQQRGYIQVEMSARDLTRGDAVKRAKGAKQGFVAMLELRSDRMRSSDTSSSRLSSVYIDFTVFAAGTGKQIASGSVYQQGSGLRDILGGSNSTNAAEQRLKNAARVAADRILTAVLQHDSQPSSPVSSR